MERPAGGGLKEALPGGRTAILLAAGPSSRMGAPKPLLPWAGTTLVRYAVGELAKAQALPIVVVLGADAERVRAGLPDLDRVVAVLNSEYGAGRSTSIRAGAAALPSGCGAVMIQSVDQPCPALILDRLYREVEAGAADLAIPAHGGRRGHPLCVAGRLVPELAAVREDDQGLRAVVRRHAETAIEVSIDSDIIHLNLNDEAAYRVAYDAGLWK
jgi:CTP:molybdopterin cytidylyltransferase MocA